MSELAKALAKAQSEFPPIERSKEVSVQTKTGGRYSFSYAPLDAILHSVSATLTANGLAVSQLLANVDGKPALRTVLLHASGDKLEDVCPLPTNGSTSPQEFGSLVTYMRRYALVALLGIATEEDDDGNAAQGNKVEGTGATSSAAGAGTGGASSAPVAGENHGEYLVAAARAQQPDAKPSEQVVHFGKNKGVLLGSMTPSQVKWYATEWKVQNDPSDYDHRLKQAAIALHAGNDFPDFDLPFE